MTNSVAEQVLVIDDDPPVRKALQKIVRSAGYECDAVGSGPAACERLADGGVDVVLCDLRLPGESGIDLLGDIGRMHPDVARVAVTGLEDPTTVAAVLATGAAGYVTKPFKRSDIEVAVQSALRRRQEESARARAEVQMETELRYRADFDPLTGLYNRRRFTEELGQHLRECARSGRSGALLILDLDHFKVVNDSLGHAAGDSVLRSTARIARRRLRETDIIGRLGSDEFAVVLADVDRDGALALAAELQRLLADPPLRPASGVSIGVACFGGSPRLAQDLMVEADQALFEAKEAGRGGVALFTGQKESGLTWVERIRDALTKDRLVVHSQPIVDLHTGEVVQEELLVRMRDSNGSLIPPGMFLPTAERFGLIEAIDAWALSRALILTSAGRRVSVNLSPKTLQDGGVLDMIEDHAGAGGNLSRLVLEITETSAISNMDLVRELAERVAGLGCGIALDDFGTGFGTFTYLKHLPIDTIKIDREFVRELTRNKLDQQMIKAIVEIARASGRRTVAEGIEDVLALDMLRRFGVDCGQGYYLGRPAALSAEAARLSDGAACLYESLRAAPSVAESPLRGMTAGRAAPMLDACS
jgi:diguanylate cyclase (GGDEF)-like protein